ncbi:MAG TPA: SET domain-containing protein-lysine N-methyltransferase [Candidatus Acidoferrales bacterium]|nr:SET domain-containing protein-lysine N-methyltransferase [Candidatus Acidoferrales bacterium]
MERPRRFSVPISTPLSKYQLRVKRSKIHRWGMFALQSIPRGRKVIEYMGERLNLKQADQRFRRNIRRGKLRANEYFARLSRGCVIDGSQSESGAQFINHSCDPNLSIRRLRGHLLLFSRRRIRRGEELLSDYAYSKAAPKTPCRCGSPKCRGFMNQA